ncbi:MAG: 2-C-methyl-D-erythritol 4-phosphate cytidylyltransferase [Bacillota bacterium]|nr:2-C-methyl-D-erythritol 4-phosphate cytidylyltransferase [Bacillota bacterium]
MIYGAILAGGVGSRMNIADMPKQFLPLGEKPIIIHTLEKFLLCQDIDEVYIGVHSQWLSHMEDLVKKYVELRRENVHVVPGGGDRNETIMAVINAIEAKYGQREDDYIITHDAVRPFVTHRIIQENIDMVKQYNACDTVVNAVDTIVMSADGATIKDIPDRSLMYQGQTPQSFQMSLLKNLYYDLSPEEKDKLTDACKICVVSNVPVYLVRGEVSNLKITTVSDYKIAQAMVGGKILD